MELTGIQQIVPAKLWIPLIRSYTVNSVNDVIVGQTATWSINSITSDLSIAELQINWNPKYLTFSAARPADPASDVMVAVDVRQVKGVMPQKRESVHRGPYESNSRVKKDYGTANVMNGSRLSDIDNGKLIVFYHGNPNNFYTGPPYNPLDDLSTPLMQLDFTVNQDAAHAPPGAIGFTVTQNFHEGSNILDPNSTISNTVIQTTVPPTTVESCRSTASLKALSYLTILFAVFLCF